MNKAYRQDGQILAKKSEDQNALPDDRRKAAFEIRRALGPLAKSAEAAGLTFVAYLLAMAAHHAEDEIIRIDEDASDPANRD